MDLKDMMLQKNFDFVMDLMQSCEDGNNRDKGLVQYQVKIVIDCDERILMMKNGACQTIGMYAAKYGYPGIIPIVKKNYRACCIRDITNRTMDDYLNNREGIVLGTSCSYSSRDD